MSVRIRIDRADSGRLQSRLAWVRISRETVSQSDSQRRFAQHLGGCEEAAPDGAA
jgi:hypothetical protein